MLLALKNESFWRFLNTVPSSEALLVTKCRRFFDDFHYKRPVKRNFFRGASVIVNRMTNRMPPGPR